MNDNQAMTLLLILKGLVNKQKFKRRDVTRRIRTRPHNITTALRELKREGRIKSYTNNPHSYYCELTNKEITKILEEHNYVVAS